MRASLYNAVEEASVDACVTMISNNATLVNPARDTPDPDEQLGRFARIDAIDSQLLDLISERRDAHKKSRG